MSRAVYGRGANGCGNQPDLSIWRKGASVISLDPVRRGRASMGGLLSSDGGIWGCNSPDNRRTGAAVR